MSDANFQNHDTSLAGAEKAAALLLAMGKDSALKLADFFSRQEIERITAAASKLNTVDVSIVENLVKEFGEEYIGSGMFTDQDGLSEFFESLAGEEDADEVGDVANPAATTSSESVAPEFEQIKSFIESEPITIGSFFLGTLDDQTAASVLSSLEKDFRQKLFKGFLERKILPDELQAKFRVQLYKLIAEVNASQGPSGDVEGAARIINFFSEQDSDEFVGFLESDVPDIAALVKKSLFKFTAISTLEKADRGILFDGVEPDDIVKALSGADDTLKESVLETLSQRNRRMVEAELGRAKTSEEDAADSQRKIAGLALSLSREGKITLPSSDGP